ncbi:similar to Kazachstania africana KAFR_0B02210 hypothetical protein [Maudiozyma barnettii]|uniref:UBR-type domain-containing protein n=1 Tax=Maudiozyma barnettii TaxID=61262 RepID=A0A8H2VH23_9SACH|nr:uncharacterized protein KABA2_06S07700 [Kazachstania barnettii]CAB4255536.1 similar to Kazachstania africana KAFR_0B02210 hypothetical protein [Kazachstania barnettii]CAD1784035.1 similar to Kazachstania africana KAFR_0B02210 hypothetical protein [Kazachstania barnettii]
MDNLTAEDYLTQQTALEEEAKELMPWDPKTCTYTLGPLKQQIYACLSHDNIGICYSCSIRCHTSCEIVELFTKRHFTCDCGTEKDKRIDSKSSAYKCEIRQNKESDIAAVDNVYGHNFEGLFCDCSKEYDPESPSVMIQCILGLVCREDWYHDYCIMGYTEDELNTVTRKLGEGKSENLIDGFPDLESFDSFICWKCVSSYKYYFQKIISNDLSKNIISCTINHGKSSHFINANGKRANSDSEIPYSIFLKEDYSKDLEKLRDSLIDRKDKLYIFLTELAPFLIKDDELYEPPTEENESMVDIISKSLSSSMSTSDIILGTTALHKLQSSLKEFLKPFAEKGEVVKDEDISSFFQSSS